MWTPGFAGKGAETSRDSGRVCVCGVGGCAGAEMWPPVNSTCVIFNNVNLAKTTLRHPLCPTEPCPPASVPVKTSLVPAQLSSGPHPGPVSKPPNTREALASASRALSLQPPNPTASSDLYHPSLPKHDFLVIWGRTSLHSASLKQRLSRLQRRGPWPRGKEVSVVRESEDRHPGSVAGPHLAGRVATWLCTGVAS